MSNAEAVTRRSFLICGATAATAIAINPIGASVRAEPEAAPRNSIEAKLDAYIRPYLEIKAFNGAILLARKGKVLASRGYGMANYDLNVPNTPQTRFHIASISKMFTAAAILLLQERGRLSVGDFLNKYIADYPRGNEITLHHLLIHTSGIVNANNLPDYETKARFPQTLTSIIEMFKDKPLTMKPGERFSYSNSNYNLLAYVIEKTSAQSYGEFLKQNIFDPLGMNDTGHDGNAGMIIKNRAMGYATVGLTDLENASYLDWTIKTGNGSLYSTTEDLYRWDRSLYTEKILRKSSLDAMFTQHVEGTGYGWFVDTRLKRRVHRFSGRSPGFQCEINRYPDDDACVIVLGNNYSGTASYMVRDLGAITFGESHETLTLVKDLRLPPQVTESYVGRYEGGQDFWRPNATFEVARRGDQLTLRWNTGATVTLVPTGETKFYDRVFGATWTFVKNDAGKVSHVIFTFDQQPYQAKKVAG